MSDVLPQATPASLTPVGRAAYQMEGLSSAASLTGCGVFSSAAAYSAKFVRRRARTDRAAFHRRVHPRRVRRREGVAATGKRRARRPDRHSGVPQGASRPSRGRALVITLLNLTFSKPSPSADLAQTI